MPLNFEGLAEFPKELCSSYIHIGNTIYSVRLILNFTGTIMFLINADDNDNHWEEITGLTSGKIKQYTLSNPGGRVRYRIVGLPGARIFNTYNNDLSKKEPGISIELLEE